MRLLPGKPQFSLEEGNLATSRKAREKADLEPLQLARKSRDTDNRSRDISRNSHDKHHNFRDNNRNPREKRDHDMSTLARKSCGESDILMRPTENLVRTEIESRPNTREVFAAKEVGLATTSRFRTRNADVSVTTQNDILAKMSGDLVRISRYLHKQLFLVEIQHGSDSRSRNRTPKSSGAT